MEKSHKCAIYTLTLDEVKNLKIHHFNRCGELDEQTALEHWTKEEYETFISRVKATKNLIVKAGKYSDLCPLVIAKMVNDENHYWLLEGQGRRGAIIELGGDYTKDGIPAIVYNEPLTEEEIMNEIRVLNTGKKNWRGSDLRHSDAKREGGDVLKAYEIIEAYKAKCGIRDYMANLLFYGHSASKTQSRGYRFDTSNFRRNYAILTNAYLSLVSQIQYDKQTTSEKNAILKQGIGQILESLYNAFNTYYDSEADIEKLKAVVEKINKRLVNYILSLNDTNYKRFCTLTCNDRMEVYNIVKSVKFRFEGERYVLDSWALSKTIKSYSMVG